MNQLDKIVFDIAHDEIPGTQVDSAAARVRQSLFGQTAAGPQRIRSCADFQTLIPAYLNRTLSAGRSLLLQDHTRECVTCRHTLQNARNGVAPTLIRPATPPSHAIANFWAIAAAAIMAVGLSGWLVSRAFVTGSGRISVQTVSGTLYAVSDRGSTPIFTGREIVPGQRIRTAKDSTAVVRLADGSLVEMGDRAELSVTSASHGTNVRLDRGNIIVQAAKQRTGTLDILTPDCTVSVKGTIFAVARGTKGTRVSVVQGAVKVAQGAQSEMLKPGDQVTTDSSLTPTAVRDEVAWSRDSARYFALLNEFNSIKKSLDAMPSSNLRYQSRLSAYVPESAVLYAAIPNVGATLGEAQRLFNERLQQSEVLRTWWSEQNEGPKLQEMVDSLRTFSQYLGDEIVVTVNGNGRGDYSLPVILAEVKLPGLEGFLTTEMRKLAMHGATPIPAAQLPQIVRLEPSSPDSHESYYGNKGRGASRVARAAHGKDNPMLIGLNDRLMVIAFDPGQLSDVAERAAADDPTPSGTLLMNNVQSSYRDGAGWLMCVNMEHIARNSVGNGRGKHGGPRMPRGIEAMRDLIVERKDIGGRTENKATLTFEGGRNGIAGWLAEPSPMGSLDFVSPNATFAVSMVLRNPSWMLGDLFQMLKEDDSQFEEELNRFSQKVRMPLSPSLAQPLGGEFTFAVDGPIIPLPSWKFAVEVYDTDRLQWTIDQFIGVFNSDSQCPDCKINIAKEQSGSRTYYTLTTDKLAYEIDYVYVDGYLVAAPSRTLLNQAIQNRETGYVLSHSEAFRSQLPRDGRLNFSAIVYHNLGSAISPIANQLSAMSGANAAQQASIKAIADNATPGLIYAYGQPDRITIATGGTFFGLDLNALALPNLINLGMHRRAGRQPPN